MTQASWKDENTGLWFQVFAVGHPVLISKQRRYAMLPGSPRCKLCEAPFGGLGGVVMKLIGLSMSPRNSDYCTACDGFLRAFPGGAEVPMSMMMVDIRDSLELSSHITPSDYAKQVIATRNDLHGIFRSTDGFVLEYQGDSVFAVWPPGFVGEDHANKALKAAELVAALGAERHDGTPDVGAAVHTGTVYMGTIPDAGGQMCGIGAFGMNVNLLGRLVHAARPGEVLVSRAVLEKVGQPPSSALRRLELKGVEVPVEAMSLGTVKMKSPVAA